MSECGHEELVEKIRQWSEAYPVEAFPEPDHEATGHDPTLCSASMGRHVIGRLMELIPEERTGEAWLDATPSRITIGDPPPDWGA